MPDCRGFTLVELIGIIAIAGILLALAAPRFFTAGTFSARGFADQAAGLLRYGQKLAVARHGDVHVQWSGATLTLCLDAAAPCPSGQGAPGPDGASPYQVSAPDGVGLSLAGGDFAFDANGRPSFAATRTLSIAADTTRTLSIEAETGYVH